MKERFVHSFARTALSPDPDLAVAALMIARIDYPQLDAGPYLDLLDALGEESKKRVESAPSASAGTPPRVDPDGYARVMALNDYLFHELRFAGNESHYQDPRNSFLNEVLDRRKGIPISLALLYIEVARRAGVRVEGINFPGHFLLRCPVRPGEPFAEDLIIDPFHGGALLSIDACRDLFRQQAGDDAEFDARLFAQATKPQILARMLQNLKRIYVGMHSFPQARDVIDLILALDPSDMHELRDRGLVAYHLKDYSRALQDLQRYLQLQPPVVRGSDGDVSDEDREARAQVWEHVKALRRRVASLN